MSKNMNILVTGYAGFIGFHLSKSILENTRHNVIGVDNFNNYYPSLIKRGRSKILKKLKKNKNFIEYKIDIKSNKLNKIFQNHKIDIVVHIAAQAGIRYTLKNPKSYIDSNIYGFFNILENIRRHKIKRLLFASTSSVYGSNEKFPFKETDKVDNPLQLYSVTKITNELMANIYSSINSFKAIGLRFFTVYGEYGRPDMAIHNFVESIDNNKFIKVYGNGNLKRDFTYIDDIVKSIVEIIQLNKQSLQNKKNKNYDIFNIGGSNPVSIKKLINIIEKYLGKKAKIIYTKKISIDMDITYASNKKLKSFISKSNFTDLDIGIKKYIQWYRSKI